MSEELGMRASKLFNQKVQSSGFKYPEPLNIEDWNVAMRLRDWVVNHTNEWLEHRITWYCEKFNREYNGKTAKTIIDEVDCYFVSVATPADYIEAACISKEKFNQLETDLKY